MDNNKTVLSDGYDTENGREDNGDYIKSMIWERKMRDSGEVINSVLPLSVDLRLSKSCNLACPFCFGTDCVETYCVEEWFEIVNKLQKNGVKVLVITGGEPILFQGLKRLIKYAHHMQFKIVLSTNGTTILDDSILHYIDALSLPLDAEDYLSCYEMRGLSQVQYNNILLNLKRFREKYPHKTIKIGTVITKKNIHKVKGIYNTIKHYADIWKIYQVSPHKKNQEIFAELEISDQEFDMLVSSLREQCADGIELITYRNADRSGKYLFCEPNFNAVSIINQEEVIIGNFSKDFDGVLAVWSKSVNKTLLRNNIQMTYPSILRDWE